MYRWIIILVYLKISIYPFNYIGQFGELPTEVVTKISLM